LAHPLGIAGFENRRVKNDRIDARLLADLLRMGRLPESWIPPEGVRHQRELVRYRRKLSQLRAGLKAQVHAVLGKEGLLPPINHLWGPGGTVWLDDTDMAEAYETRVRSLRRLIKLYDSEISKLDTRIAAEFKGHPGYETIQELNGVGPVFAATFTAELGDVTRFGSEKHVCSWAGLTPRHRESDTTVHRGSITKQGSGLVRWAAIEAISKNHGDDPIKDLYRRVAERRGKNKGRVAAARKLLTLVYYGLRDGEIRSLVPPEAT
jgi:transposase